MNDNTKGEIEMEQELNDRIMGRPVKLNTVACKESKKKLIPIGDLHYGSPFFDRTKLQDTIDYAKKSNAWVLLMGDLFEAATRYSVGAGVYEQTKTPQQQLEDLTEMFEPIKDQIIGSHIGNHEFRILKDDGINIMKIFCKYLGIRYLGYSCSHVLRVNGRRYVVYSTHGSSGATLRHTKIKKVLDISNFIQADLYLYAHTHSLDLKTDEYRAYDSKQKIMATRKRYFVLTGSFLKYDGSYADMKNFQPEKMGVAKVMLFGDRHDIHVSI